MGNASFFQSSLFTNQYNSRVVSLDKRILSSFPSYYLQDLVITENDISVAQNSWQLVMNGEDVEHFKAAKCSKNFEFSSCLTWFFSVFFERFFVLCPIARDMFVHVSIVAQGRLLAGVISSSLGVLRNPDGLKKRLIKIVDKHNTKGIEASFYGIMGDALFWTFNYVLGSQYDEKCDLAWKKIYSFLLSIIIPRAVGYQMKSKTSQRDADNSRYSSDSNNIRTSIGSLKIAIEERIRGSRSLLNAEKSKRSRSVSPVNSHRVAIENAKAKLALSDPDEVCPFSSDVSNIKSPDDAIDPSLGKEQRHSFMTHSKKIPTPISAEAIEFDSRNRKKFHPQLRVMSVESINNDNSISYSEKKRYSSSSSISPNVMITTTTNNVDNNIAIVSELAAAPSTQQHEMSDIYNNGGSSDEVLTNPNFKEAPPTRYFHYSNTSSAAGGGHASK